MYNEVIQYIALKIKNCIAKLTKMKYLYVDSE